MQEFINFAKHLADVSAEVIKPYFRRPFSIERKGDDSPVTIADKKAEEVMREAIMREFPEHGIIGEEFDDHNPDANYKWILDPIDGTNGFISGTTQFTTLIALMQNGRSMLGVINQPIMNEFLIGDGESTTLNGQPARVRECNRIEDATLLTYSHWRIHEVHNGAAFDALSKRARLYRTWGGSPGYVPLATGFADVLLSPAMGLWDVAPLPPIIEGAGGRMTSWSGGDPIAEGTGIATAGTVHDEVLRLLNPEDAS